MNKASANDSPVPGYSASNWPTGGCAGGSQGRCTMAKSAEKTYTMIRGLDSKVGTQTETKKIMGGYQTTEKTTRGQLVQRCVILNTREGIERVCTPKDRVEVYESTRASFASGTLDTGGFAFFRGLTVRDESQLSLPSAKDGTDVIIIKGVIDCPFDKAANLQSITAIAWKYNGEELWHDASTAPHPNVTPWTQVDLYATEASTRGEQMQSVVALANTIDFSLARTLALEAKGAAQTTATNEPQTEGRMASDFHKAADVMHRDGDASAVDRQRMQELENDMLVGLA